MSKCKRYTEQFNDAFPIARQYDQIVNVEPELVKYLDQPPEFHT